MVVAKGLIRRHGWTEVGGRQTGCYGRAMHTGSCLAVGYVPFEVSCERTKWYLTEMLKPHLANTEKHRDHLLTKPPLTIYAKSCPRTHHFFPHRETRQVTLMNVEKAETVDDLPQQDAYKYQHSNATYAAKNEITALTKEVARVEAAIETWKPGKVWEGEER